MSDSFASAAELAQYTGLSEPPDLARLQSLLAASSAVIRQYTGLKLSQVVGDVIVIQPQYSQTTGQTFPLPGAAFGEMILLPERPVTAVAITVDAVAFTAFGFTSAGLVYRTDGLAWTKAATVTYTHGFAETTDEYATIRKICIEAALRAYSRDERGIAEAMGGTIMETSGWVPVVFLTEADKAQLEFGRAYIG